MEVNPIAGVARLQITAGHQTYVRQKWPFVHQNQALVVLKTGTLAVEIFIFVPNI